MNTIPKQSPSSVQDKNEVWTDEGDCCYVNV